MEHTMQTHLTSFSFFYGKIRVEILVRLSNKSRWVLGVWEVDKSSGVRGFRKWKRKWKLTKVLVMQQMPLQAVKLSQSKPLLLYYGLPILPPWHLLFLLVALSKPLLLVLLQLWPRLRKGSASSAKFFGTNLERHLLARHSDKVSSKLRVKRAVFWANDISSESRGEVKGRCNEYTYQCGMRGRGAMMMRKT